MSTKEKSGYLTKQGKTVKNWRKRWVVLKNKELHYFKTKDDASPLDSISLTECSCSFALYCETKKRSCLKINTPRRIWFFAADTDEEIGLWLEALFLWGVPETHEEDEIINPIVESTNALPAMAVSVIQQTTSGTAETFRDACRAATQRMDTFTASIQAITKFYSSVKYSPSPNFNDFLKEMTTTSGSIRDTFLAFVTIASDARESPTDSETRRKLGMAGNTLPEKIANFKKLILDESKGLRAQLRTILYGKYKAITPASPLPTRAQANAATTIVSGASSGVGFSSSGSSIPPLTINSSPTFYSPASAAYNNTPPSPTSPILPGTPHFQPHRGSSSPRPFSQSLSGSTGISAPMYDEQCTLFDDLISMSKDLVQIMKNLRATEIESVSMLPKSGYVTAMMCVKAARDYANLHLQLGTRQAILAAAGRVFVATNQLYNPLNNDEEYSTDELLKALSQSVLALVTIILHHHNYLPPSPSLPPPPSPPTSPTPSLSGSGNMSPLVPRAHDEISNGVNRVEQSMSRSQSVGRFPERKNGPIVRHGSGSNEVPQLITSTDGDVNIWDENQEEGVNVVFIEDEGISADGELPIRGGTLNQIIKRLTNENKPELRFVKAFIITYLSITTAEVFFNKLIQRYQVPISVIEEKTLQNSEWKQQKLRPIQLRVFNVLKLWLEHRFDDFTHPLLMKLKLFMEENFRRDGHEKLADQLNNIIKRKTSLDSARKSLTIPLPIMTKEAFWKKYSGEFVLAQDEDEMAKQLTLIEFATYKAIEPLEVLNQAWNKAALRHRAPNVMRMISRFNSISFWVARLIVNEERLRSRVKMVTKLARFAQALYKENNLNSLLAVVSGLNNAAIHRLKFTHEELPSKEAESLVKFGSLLSTDMGYKNYRNRVHSINPPLIPYLGIYLTDLTFIDEGNPDYLEGKNGNKLINFRKREMTFNVISEMQQYQQESYKFESNEPLIAYLAELPIIESDSKTLEREHKELYDLSLQREPRSALKSDIVL